MLPAERHRRPIEERLGLRQHRCGLEAREDGLGALERRPGVVGTAQREQRPAVPEQAKATLGSRCSGRPSDGWHRGRHRRPRRDRRGPRGWLSGCATAFSANRTCSSALSRIAAARSRSPRSIAVRMSVGIRLNHHDTPTSSSDTSSASRRRASAVSPSMKRIALTMPRPALRLSGASVCRAVRSIQSSRSAPGSSPRRMVDSEPRHPQVQLDRRSAHLAELGVEPGIVLDGPDRARPRSKRAWRMLVSSHARSARRPLARPKATVSSMNGRISAAPTSLPQTIARLIRKDIADWPSPAAVRASMPPPDLVNPLADRPASRGRDHAIR